MDYEARRIQLYRKKPAAPGSTYPVIEAEQIELGEADPLRDEIAAFAESVRTRSEPRVSAEDGLRVIELSERIRLAIKNESPPPQH